MNSQVEYQRIADLKIRDSQRIHGRKSVQFPLMPSKYIVPNDYIQPKQQANKKDNDGQVTQVICVQANGLKLQRSGMKYLNRSSSDKLAYLRPHVQPNSYFRPQRIDPKIREAFTQIKKINIDGKDYKQIRSMGLDLQANFLKKLQAKKLNPLIQSQKNIEQKLGLQYLLEGDQDNEAGNYEMIQNLFSKTDLKLNPDEKENESMMLIKMIKEVDEDNA